MKSSFVALAPITGFNGSLSFRKIPPKNFSTLFNNINNNNNNNNNNPSQEFLNLVGSIRQVALVGNVDQPGGEN